MNDNIINYYNGDSLLINTPEGEEYGGISAWQGIRNIGADIYLITGTTNPSPNTGYGLIYIGNINCQDGEIYYLNVPNSVGTSVYGPNYDKNTGIYNFVGSYSATNQNIYGFVYQGNLNELSNESNFSYPSINNYFNINFFHSFSNNLFVGNSGNKDKDNDTLSYIYDMNDLVRVKTVIKYPNSVTTTTYGIWYNGNNIYTIVGGYSSQNISINKIYTNNGVKPIGNAFIADYNSETNSFYNWTSISYGDNLLTHFQGISKNLDGIYSINSDVIDLKKSLLPTGYFLTIERNYKNEFVYNLSNSIKILYNEEGISSSNSVADNKVVGLYIGPDQKKISYQAEIIKNMNYNGCGVYTFLESGTYLINFNISIEKLLNPINRNVEIYNFNPNAESVLLCFPGGGETVSEFINYTNFKGIASTVIAFNGQSTINKYSFQNAYPWIEKTIAQNDILIIDSVLSNLYNKLPKNIFLTGKSDGGGFCILYANLSKHKSRIKGIGICSSAHFGEDSISNIGIYCKNNSYLLKINPSIINIYDEASSTNKPITTINENCNTNIPYNIITPPPHVSIFIIHGTADTVMPYDGQFYNNSLAKKNASISIWTDIDKSLNNTYTVNFPSYTKEIIKQLGKLSECPYISHSTTTYSYLSASNLYDNVINTITIVGQDHCWSGHINSGPNSSDTANLQLDATYLLTLFFELDLGNYTNSTIPYTYNIIPPNLKTYNNKPLVSK